MIPSIRATSLNYNKELEEIIQDALGDGSSASYTHTTVVALHLSQMREWGVRGGHIQIKPIQDIGGIRDKFVAAIQESNNLSQRLDTVMDALCARGEVLWLLKESEDEENSSGYEIDFFVGGKHNPNAEYYTFYNEKQPEKIQCVVTKTWYEDTRVNREVISESALLGLLTGNQFANKIWFLTFYDRERIIRLNCGNQEPRSLSNLYYLYQNPEASFLKPQIKPNPFAPRLPFTISKNKFQRNSNFPGIDDFNPLAGMITEHNRLLKNASTNLRTFNTPTLVTSRDASDVVDAVSPDTQDNTWAGLNGYRGIETAKNNYQMPRVIGGVRDGERFGYIQSPDVVSGDQNLYIRALRELIHWTLGGVDPLGISSSATFGEIKSLFGRIENTSLKKMDALLGRQGLCKLVSLAIQHEENKCKLALTKFLIARFAETGNNFSDNQINLTDETFRNLYFYCVDDLGLKIPGLPPLGVADCSWRHTREVFQNTADDLLKKSIVFRNEREDGVSQKFALSKLYPGLRDDEIRQMMAGFSPRVVESALGGISGALSLYDRLMSLPDPENPEIPWGVRLGVGQLVEQGVVTLAKELTYNMPDFQESPPSPYNNVLQEVVKQVEARSRSASASS